jgi:hypothetical protein
VGLTAATLNDHRVTSARVYVPAWGRWFAEVDVDGEHELTGSVTLKIADLTLKGAVLSGGAAKGRSHYRLVAGAGTWGQSVPKKDYSNDAQVKASTVLSDAAGAVKEPIGKAPSGTVGPKFVRPEGPAMSVLEHVAPKGWYVDNDGVTQIGKRAAGKLPAGVTHGPVDLARGTVTLASDSIVDIMPGLVVDGLTAVDVLHKISVDGLRSKVWGARGADGSRIADAIWAHVDQYDPDRRFRGLTEYRVVDQEGERLSLQPVRVSTGMPDLRRVPMRPGVSGCKAEVALGSRVLVGFADSDPGRPFVASFEDAEGDGFLPVTLELTGAKVQLKGGEGLFAGVAGEHVMTTEACALFVYNVLVVLMSTAGGGPLLAAVLQPLIMPAITAAIAAQGAPAPPGNEAQQILAATLASTMSAGTTPSQTSLPFNSAIAGMLSTKTPNESGAFPSLGSSFVEAG